MSEAPLPSVRGRVLAAIAAGRVKMRPRWHYILKGALLATGAAMVALALLFMVSFIIFYLQQSGVWVAPSFGLRGLQVFLASLPWLLIVVAIVFLVLLEVLVKHYAFAYRQPLLYSALGLVLLATVGGIAVAQTPLHAGFLRQAREHRLPWGEPLYREFGLRGPRNVRAGTILSLTDTGFVLRTRQGEELTVTVTPQTRFPMGYDLAEGDAVAVIGERANGSVQAFGVREIGTLPDEFELKLRRQFPRHFQPPMHPETPPPME